MKNVLQKMAQYEQKEIETKLASHEIELASVQEIVSSTQLAASELDIFNKKYGDLMAIAKLTIQSGKKYLNVVERLNSQVNEWSKSAKSIGLDPESYKEIKDAKYISVKGNPSVIQSMVSDAEKLI